jgi:hypothetical protein
MSFVGGTPPAHEFKCEPELNKVEGWPHPQSDHGAQAMR